MPSKPTGPAARDPEPDAGLQARLEAQLLLGQLHGALHKVVEGAESWLPADEVQPVREAYADVGSSFGTAQAALNSGTHDKQLAGAGLAGAQAEPKKRGFRQALNRWIQASVQATDQALRALKPVLRWGRTYVSSLATVVPGAEAIGEFVEVIQNSLEDLDDEDDGR